MSDPNGARLIRTCEAICESVQRHVPFTSFSMEIQRVPTPLVVSFRTSDALQTIDAQRDLPPLPVPARLEFELRRGDHLVARLRIEDERHAQFPEGTREMCERIAAEHVDELSSLIAAPER